MPKQFGANSIWLSAFYKVSLFSFIEPLAKLLPRIWLKLIKAVDASAILTICAD
jgi:hypothetical protein